LPRWNCAAGAQREPLVYVDLQEASHTPFFAPDREPTIRASVSALTYPALALLAHPAAILKP
jgi:hypothetical protein